MMVLVDVVKRRLVTVCCKRGNSEREKGGTEKCAKEDPLDAIVSIVADPLSYRSVVAEINLLRVEGGISAIGLPRERVPAKVLIIHVSRGASLCLCLGVLPPALQTHQGRRPPPSPLSQTQPPTSTHHLRPPSWTLILEGSSNSEGPVSVGNTTLPHQYIIIIQFHRLPPSICHYYRTAKMDHHQHNQHHRHRRVIL